jgi:hypothetical protein
MEWFKDTSDYQRIHATEEIEEFLSLQPQDIFVWLYDVAHLCWEVKKAIII